MTMIRFHAPAKKYAAYIFDCDGTLADTMPVHFEAWRRALKEGGAGFEFTWELFNRRAGMGMEETVQELSDQFEQPLDSRAVAAGQRKFYQSLRHEVSAIDEVCAFARRVSSFAPVAVASGSLKPHVEQTLTQIGMTDVFQIIITPEDVLRGKPAPDLFLLAAERMGSLASETLVLEDAEFGFEAARQAKMDFARVLVPKVY